MPRKQAGASTAERALTTGEPLQDGAALAALNVEAELEKDGPDALAKRGAIRLQAVADLYFALITGATSSDRLDLLVKRWAWIQNSAIRAWAQVKANGKGSKHDAAWVIAAMQATANDADE